MSRNDEPMRDVGLRWEQAACDYLKTQGMQLLTRNFHCRFGEIDLVMCDTGARDKNCIVFVEVRFRRSNSRGGGLASVGPAKRAKLRNAAEVFLQSNPRLANQACRFDVIACSGTPRHPRFEWIRNAFEAC